MSKKNASARRRPKLLFVVTEDWYFVSHRLALASAALNAGYDVAIATHVERHKKTIENAGIRVIPVSFNRGGMNPFEELASLASLLRLYLHEKPDVVHHVAMKPVIYGSLAARLARVPCVVNALGGLGFLFSSRGIRARIARIFALPMLKVSLNVKRSILILQNRFDQETVIQSRLTQRSCIRLIRGAGVDPNKFSLTNIKKQPPLVILPARLLREKGVLEFVESARQLRAAKIEARFALVGAPDPKNPGSIKEADIDQWVDEEIIEYWGWKDDMRDVLMHTQIVCLPTFYGEGIPKSLLDAAAAGCAIIASDNPGCLELIQDGANGLIVPAKDPAKLAESLTRLITNPELRDHLGIAARNSVIRDFSLRYVISETLSVYAELLHRSGRSAYSNTDQELFLERLE